MPAEETTPNLTLDALAAESAPTIANGDPLEPDDTRAYAAVPDEDDDWAIQGPGRGIRVGPVLGIFAAVVLVSLGFWGGAVLEKSHASAATGGGAAAGFARLRAAAAGGTGATGTTGATGATGAAGAAGAGTGFPSFGGGTTSGTVGTISVVDGDTLYVLTSAGALVQVRIGASATITRNAKSTSTGLRPGDTVVVQGATNSSGNVAATSVAATAAGVTASTGFGGGGFGGRRGSSAGATGG